LENVYDYMYVASMPRDFSRSQACSRINDARQPHGYYRSLTGSGRWPSE